MSGWAIAGIAFLLFVAWTILLNRRFRMKHARIAASRPPHDEMTFTQAMAVEGVDPKTARFLWTELKGYYFSPLSPAPEDKVRSMMEIDPDDICDIAENVWKAASGPDDFDTPVKIPDDPSIAELGRFLDARLNLSSTHSG